MKNDCLYVCRAAAAFFVVFIHCSFPSPAGGMMNGLARFAVPLFFMISGYFCYGKGLDTVRRRAGRMFRLFLLGNGVYFLWKLAAMAAEGTLSFAAAAELFAPERLLSWVILNQSPFMGHLWFLGALLYCYIIYALLVKWQWEERLYGLIPLFLSVNLLLGEILSVLGISVNFLYARNFLLTGLPFFLWGHWFGREQERGRFPIVVRDAGRDRENGVALAVFLLGACMSMGEMLLSGGGELYLGSILMAGSLFYLALRNPSFGRGSLAARIGERDSLHIYLWQLILYDMTEALAYTWGIREHMVYQWLMPLWICLISWGLAELIGKMKTRKGKGL